MRARNQSTRPQKQGVGLKVGRWVPKEEQGERPTLWPIGQGGALAFEFGCGPKGPQHGKRIWASVAQPGNMAPGIGRFDALGRPQAEVVVLGPR
jgi:hypothetical protein